MAKMSRAQRIAVLSQHSTSKGATMVVTARTATAMVRDEFAVYPLHVTPAVAAAGKVRYVYVTRAGLIAAGVDMDAIEEDAYAENRARTAVAKRTSPDMVVTVPEVHAFGTLRAHAVARPAACGAGYDVARGPDRMVTCPACRELLAQRAQTPAEAEAAVAALTQDPHEYPAPYAMGPTSRAAQMLGRVARTGYRCPIPRCALHSTPAEAALPNQ